MSMKVFFSNSLVHTVGTFDENLLLNSDVYEWLIDNVGHGFREPWCKPASEWHWWFGLTEQMIDYDDLDTGFPLSAVIPVIEFRDSNHAILFKLTWGGQ